MVQRCSDASNNHCSDGVHHVHQVPTTHEQIGLESTPGNDPFEEENLLVHDISCVVYTTSQLLYGHEERL